jgi:deoxyribonuclease V
MAVTIVRQFWPDQKMTPEQVFPLQDRWAKLVVEQPLPAPPTLIAGCDVHLRGDLARATVVVLRFPELEVVETVHGAIAIDFPYVPGLLSWRELPPLLTALKKLTVRPDLLMADGQGLAHPRRFGLACHLGLASGLPSFGGAKSILRGTHDPVGEEKGATAPLVYRGQVVGMALRSKDRVKPLIVSVGHLTTLDEAVEYVLRCSLKHRLPEPNRLAHVAAQAWARGADE